MKPIQKKTSKGLILVVAASLLAAPSPSLASEELTYHTNKNNSLAVELVGRYTSDAAIDEGGTEIVAYDPNSYRAFSVNGAKKALDIIDLSALQEGSETIPLIKRITLSDIGVEAGDVTSVAIHPDGDYIAIAAPAENKEKPGHVVFMSTDGEPLSHVQVGALPDMLTFTPDGTKVLVANEGEPKEDYSINPEGSVSIIDVSANIAAVTGSNVTNVPFSADVLDGDIRKVHPESTHAEDMEPEYITIDADGAFAYVALQEVNAIAKLDINNAAFVTVKDLGYKDYSAGNNLLDASDEDGEINTRHWPVLSMYQPDSITSFEAGGQSYILTANEGDAQDWEGFSEEARVEDLADEYALNADLFEGYNQEELDQLVEDGLFDEDQLGRLKTSISHPKNSDGKYEAVYSYGGRSFSVWNADTLEPVYDSGADFEQLIEQFTPDYFHSDNDEDGMDSRSDDKGVEPESIITGNVENKDYAFIGLERQGGVMVYDLADPASPSFDSYFSSRNFNGNEAEVTEASRDVAPEGLTFIPAENSPIDQELLLTAHEVSGTIAVYALGGKADEQTTDGEPLADTATSSANHLLAGALLALMGSVMAFRKKIVSLFTS